MGWVGEGLGWTGGGRTGGRQTAGVAESLALRLMGTSREEGPCLAVSGGVVSGAAGLVWVRPAESYPEGRRLQHFLWVILN